MSGEPNRLVTAAIDAVAGGRDLSAQEASAVLAENGGRTPTILYAAVLATVSFLAMLLWQSASRRSEVAGNPAACEEMRVAVLMSITSIIGGLAEAALLVLIARIALALASDDSSVTFNLGPVHDWTVSVTVLLSTAAVLVLVRMAFQSMQTVLAARATFVTVANVRKSLIRRFLAADWALQSQQREGRLQELATTYATATSGAVGGITGIAISGFNLLALLGNRNRLSAVLNLSWRYLTWGHGGGIIVGDDPAPFLVDGPLPVGSDRGHGSGPSGA